jgi:hypothetical protein
MKLAKIAIVTAAVLVVVPTTLWGILALWYQVPAAEPLRVACAGLWAVLALGLLTAWLKSRKVWWLGAYGLAFVSLLAWWQTIAPSNVRPWADDVARLLHGSVNGHEVTLTNVRDFTWRTDSDYDPRWETRRYDLDHLVSTDVVLSYWSGPAIAHSMLSFGFDDGSHVVFSVEIRRRRGQQYSSLGGFFKDFEMTLIAADERDIIRVRTNVRGEDDHLYPLHIDRAAMRALFLSYVRLANELVVAPAYYNTVTTNCTTMVYRLAKPIDPGLPFDIRLLFTGYLPEYLERIGVLAPGVPLAELRRRSDITARARAAPITADFSAEIRAPIR